MATLVPKRSQKSREELLERILPEETAEPCAPGYLGRVDVETAASLAGEAANDAAGRRAVTRVWRHQYAKISAPTPRVMLSRASCQGRRRISLFMNEASLHETAGGGR